MPIDNNENKEFKPVIVAFCCNWCSYAGADLAGSSRLSYPADVKIIRVPCSCRVNPLFILRAFQKGADGVILCGMGIRRRRCEILPDHERVHRAGYKPW